MKRRTKILIIVIGALLLAALVLVANITRSNSVVQDLEVEIRYGRTPVLVDSQVVRDTVLRAIPQLRQTTVKSVDCDRVTTAASHVPYLTDITTSTTVSGRVLVKAKQRRPIARVFYGTREMYLDQEGALFPISPLGECNVLVMNGEFTEPLRLDSLNADYDRNRLEEEMIYYIEKLDINEEKQRLANHLRYFSDTMAQDEPQGKKLGFIAQEMGREINTLGSKSNHAEMQRLVVRMKDELEQIKEQVLNVL